MTALQGVLAWLHAQAAAMIATLGDVAANRLAPARQVWIYTLVLVGLGWAIPKVFKILKK